MDVGRTGATATLLPDDSVLEAGGCTANCTGGGRGSSLSSTLTWSSPHWFGNTSMTQPRAYAAATELPDGSVLVAGGDGNGISGRLSTAELYTPILMSMHPDRAPSGAQVTVTGSGFYAHEAVEIQWTLEGQVIGRPVTTPTGTFTTTVTIPSATPGTYQITATGNRSANTLKQALTTFTVTGQGT